jgi:hypothetical protein
LGHNAAQWLLVLVLMLLVLVAPQLSHAVVGLPPLFLRGRNDCLLLKLLPGLVNDPLRRIGHRMRAGGAPNEQ